MIHNVDNIKAPELPLTCVCKPVLIIIHNMDIDTMETYVLTPKKNMLSMSVYQCYLEVRYSPSPSVSTITFLGSLFSTAIYTSGRLKLASYHQTQYLSLQTYTAKVETENVYVYIPWHKHRNWK